MCCFWEHDFSSASVTTFGLVTHTKEVSMLSFTELLRWKKMTDDIRSSSPVNREVAERHASFIWHNEVITTSRVSTGTQTFSRKAWIFLNRWFSFSSPFSYDDSHGFEKWFAYVLAAFSSLFQGIHWSPGVIPITVYMKALQLAHNDSIVIQSRSLNARQSQFKFSPDKPAWCTSSWYILLTIHHVMQTAKIKCCVPLKT